MHRVFYVEELVRWIALNANEGSSGSASLLALARCCKVLEGPAMDVLWQRQKLLVVILRTLPADCWIVTDGVYVGRSYLHPSSHSPLVQRLTNIPTSGEWERFKTYTARVVELNIGGVCALGAGSLEASPETISFLGMQSTVDTLWPRVTSLILASRSSWDAVASSLAFLSPKIQSLALILPQDTSVLLQPILSIASSRCHQVHELVLDIVVGDSHSAHRVGGLISACRDTLRTLEVRSPYKTEYLPIISNLPQLRTLCLQSPSLPCRIAFGSFPVLEEFTFKHLQGCRIEHFLKSLGTTGLKVANIYSTDAIDLRKSIAALSRFSTSLRDLEITGITSLDLASVPTPRPPFTNLRSVRLSCHPWGAIHKSCTLRLSDEAVAELGETMPNVIHLTLGDPACPNLRCATFLSLVSLSKTCRGLETLKLKVDFRTMVTPSLSFSGGNDVGTGAAPDETRGRACKLRKLVVGSSILPNPPESGWIVAIGLGKIFPFLTEVEGFGRGRSNCKWEQVGGYIRMSRQVLRIVGNSGA